MTQPSVLLVDDEITILRVFSWQLRAEHFAVTTVASGREAISALQNGHYDIVVTDLIMEEVDGFEVLSTAKKIAPLTPVIIMSGHRHSAKDAFALGADDFLAKPFDVEELIFKIHHFLDLQMERTLDLEEV